MSNRYTIRIATTLAGYRKLCEKLDAVPRKHPLIGIDSHPSSKESRICRPDIIINDGQRSDNTVIFGWDRCPYDLFFEERYIIDTLRELDEEDIPWHLAYIGESDDGGDIGELCGAKLPNPCIGFALTSCFSKRNPDGTFSDIVDII